MATSNLAIFPQVIQTWAQQIANADGTNKKTLVTGGANGSIIESITVSLNDVVNALFLWINDGTTSHQLTIVPVPANAGNSSSGIAAVDVLRSGFLPGLVFDSNGNPTMPLKAGYILQVGANAAVTAGKFLDVVAFGTDY